MDIYVYDTSYTPVAVIDEFSSLIWTKRYYDCGDFEIVIPADSDAMQYLQNDYILIRDDDDSGMVIEDIQITTDAESSDYFIVSGRSLEGLLSRRIVLFQTIIQDSEAVHGIKHLIVTHTGNGDPDSYRAIPGLTIDDSLVTGKPLIAQFTGQNLLSAVSQLCQRFGIGIKATLSGQNIILSFYEGSTTDVIFSPDFDNLINSKYHTDYKNLANYAKVVGEGEGNQRIGVQMSVGSPSGLSLREIYVDARDISSNTDTPITSDDYISMLIERGEEKLAEHSVSRTFEAEIETKNTFRYKQDYDLGDIVTISNEYGVTSNPRIVEIIESWDSSGYKCIPKFDKLEVLS